MFRKESIQVLNLQTFVNDSHVVLIHVVVQVHEWIIERKENKTSAQFTNPQNMSRKRLRQ